MINKHEITGEQAKLAMKSGEFDNDVVSSKKIVAVIMTQDWCPQWANMRSWIYDMQTEKDIDIYELIYNKTDYFRDFMSFKESKWKNYEIPYLRYYKDGKLYKETNYIGKREFINIIGA